VGANYRSATRAKSPADFISKMGWVEEEADECGYWLDLLAGSGKIPPRAIDALVQESSELVAIAVASINTAKRRESQQKTKPATVAQAGRTTGRRRDPSGASIPRSELRVPRSL
jgi:hypothetical protein